MPPAADHTRCIVGALTLIALVCVGCTTYLLAAGYQSGELMVGIASGAAGSLGTMLAMRRSPQTGGPGDTNVAGDATLNVTPSVQPTNPTT